MKIRVGLLRRIIKEELERIDEKEYKASTASQAAFKKGAKGHRGKSARRKGFRSVYKQAEKWADEPGAVAQAATIAMTGKPAVAKGEHRKD